MIWTLSKDLFCCFQTCNKATILAIEAPTRLVEGEWLSSQKLKLELASLVLFRLIVLDDLSEQSPFFGT